MKSLNEFKDFFLNNKKTIIIVISFILTILILSFGLIYYNFSVKDKVNLVNNSIASKKNDNLSLLDEVKEKNKEKNIIVEIKGEVKNPGVYEVKENNRVNDVIFLAGGITDSGNTRYINLSKKVTDEMVIIIHSFEEINKLKEKNSIVEKLPILKDDSLEDYLSENVKNNFIKDDLNNKNKDLSKVSLNKATLKELMTLNSIGEIKAKEIIEYREKNGGFKNIEELKEIKGIGDSIFVKIKESITL